MPYQVQQIIEGKGRPVCVAKDDSVSKALALMIEHDFSQLPVISNEGVTDIPDGMITYEGILRGIRNFRANIQDLRVRDVMTAAPVYALEDDLFDILDRLKETNAVLVTEDQGGGPDLVGIVTSYDTAEYFRTRTEDLMRVEDIELMVKEFIRYAYLDSNSELDEDRLNGVIARVTNTLARNPANPERTKTFNELSLGDYISLLLTKETWSVLEPALGVQRSFVKELLNGVREIRNALAHFRGEISPEERDRLQFGAEWLSRCQDEYHVRKTKEERQRILAQFADRDGKTSPLPILEEQARDYPGDLTKQGSTDFSVVESTAGGGRYAALADWLQSQPGHLDRIQLGFNDIEEIIKADLPASARKHRAWWANDSISHSHSQLWLDAGWRTTYVNLTEGKITFSRIREREKAYIAFFSKLLDDLRKNSDILWKDTSPDGASWIVIKGIPRTGPSCGFFTFAFTRSKRFRVELYIDLGEYDETKRVFDSLFSNRKEIESQIGIVAWERLENRRASRLALYHEGQITDSESLPELRRWAVDSMVKFYNTLIEPAEEAIIEARKK